MDYTIRIGGEAGQGLQTMGAALAKIFSRMRYHVFTHQDYMSRIRGGHNFYQIRISDQPISSSRALVHILIALNSETIDIHYDDLHEDGIILFDPETVDDKLEGDVFLPTPFADIAVEAGGKKIMANSVAIGAVLGIFDFRTDKAAEVISESLDKKSEDIVESNTRAMEAGHRHARENCTRLDSFQRDPAGDDKLLLINGTQALAFGAIASGCRFYCACKGNG
jgi:2-oxoglutarate ferredoxin oxidoreductase subunit alpha